MSIDAYLWIDGISGESTDSDCKNWIEINTFCLSASQSVSRTASSAGGATVARVYLSDFSIVKLADSATPKILEACCAGRHIKQMKLYVRRAGGDKQKYLEYVFDEVIISGVVSGNLFERSPSNFPEEVVRFNYAKISMQYSQQSRTTGLIIGQISGGWDQIRNSTYA
ncbi:type VI secretion system tube protein Hcp [Pseudomonas syringae]|uniref:Hcp family type VI secretion system effector n=1 Tax=Pseudomonas syringae group TaxID=136849 RepID=UPI000CD1B6BC|nr:MULTISPECIES: type VI secretion system tube protein Hcp [Pseudomonas syringae group]POD54887.1 fimbrial protein [Pseudomonas syringae pv. syringae]UZS71886.1 type VI secretion system tube protein Hcp [Pseudomonas syringae]